MQDFITAVPSDLSETPKTSETGTTSKFLIENDSKTTMSDKLFGEFNYRKECKIVAKVKDTLSSSDRKKISVFELRCHNKSIGSSPGTKPNTNE